MLRKMCDVVDDDGEGDKRRRAGERDSARAPTEHWQIRAKFADRHHRHLSRASPSSSYLLA